MATTKVVQTRLDANLYQALQRAADSKSMTLMDAAREAIRRWVMEETRFGGSPLFNLEVVLGKGPSTDSSDDDTTVYRRRKGRNSSSTRGRS
jgi:hypothetical protein